MKAFASLGALALLTAPASAADHKKTLKQNLVKLGYDDAHFAKKLRMQKELAYKAEQYHAAHETKMRRRLRQAEDSSDLVFSLFAVFGGVVDGASFETQSTCNVSISSMMDNMLSAYEAVENNQYWSIAVYQDSILDNGAMLYAFCSFEHYQNVIDLMTNFDDVDMDALSQGFEHGEFNAFWGSDTISQFTFMGSRLTGWLIEDRKKLDKCGAKWDKKQGKAKRDAQAEFGKCWGKFTTVVFDSYI